MTSFLQFVENRLKESPEDTLLAGAFASFRKSVADTSPSLPPDADILRKWIIGMMYDGLRPTTYRRYAGRLHTLHKEWRRNPGPDPFDEVRELLIVNANEGPGGSQENLNRLTRLIRHTNGAIVSEKFNILLYLVIDPGATVEDIVHLTFGHPVPDVSQLHDILDRMRASGRKKYVFGLNQGKQRPAAIEAALTQSLISTMRGYALLADEDTETMASAFGASTIEAYASGIWIAAARSLSIPSEDIAAIIRRIPEEYAYLRTLPRKNLDSTERLRIMQRVADSISDKTTRWFIMRMRGGVDPEDIRNAIKEKAPSLRKEIEYYYPTHTVVAIDKNKRKKKRREPYLPGILFFRMRRDKVGRLFSKIGDLAWCYRHNPDPSSPYCAISNGEMKRFQYHIGHFTPDIRIQLIERDSPLAEGTEVKITGGGRMEGHIGIITAIRNADGTRTYTLRLSGSATASWTVADIPGLYLTPN